MILSSYLRELSVKANKRRNNQRELLNLVPNIDFYSTSKNRFVEKKELPKKEIKMKKKKGLMEIIDKEEPVKKEEEQSAGNDITEVTPEEEQIAVSDINDGRLKEEQSAVSDINGEQIAGSDIKKIFIKQPQEGGESPKTVETKNITLTSFF